jgi:hypothetical protein
MPGDFFNLRRKIGNGLDFHSAIIGFGSFRLNLNLILGEWILETSRYDLANCC